MSASLERALESARRSVFGVLEDEQLRMLLHDSFEFEVIPGQSLYRAGDESRLGLVLEGRIRMYFTAENGRELVVRYAGPDEWIGLPAVVGGPVEIDVEATEPTRVQVASGENLRRLAMRDAGFAWLVAQECVRRLNGVLDELGFVAFASLRRRLARALLQNARGGFDPLRASDSKEREIEPGEDGGVALTQQELADVVGSTREATARCLRELRELGCLAEGELRVIDASRLTEIARAGL